MTDQSADDNRDDELRDALQEAFARKPPPDVVPPPELTAERLRHLDSMTAAGARSPHLGNRSMPPTAAWRA